MYLFHKNQNRFSSHFHSTLEPLWLHNIHVNLRATERQANEFATKFSAHDPDDILHWALKALSLTDLTTLAGDDTKSNVQRLCQLAAFPFPYELQAKLKQSHPEVKRPHTAAICVYPSRVADAREIMQRMQMSDRIQIAAGKSYLFIIILYLFVFKKLDYYCLLGLFI